MKHLTFFLLITLTACGDSGSGSDGSTIPTANPSLGTLAGRISGDPGSSDGNGSAASFANPKGIAIGSDGNIYVADRDNCIIRKVTGAGMVSTVAGAAGLPGDTDGSAGEARFRAPDWLAADNKGNIYVSEGSALRKIEPSGTVSTLARWPTYGGDPWSGTLSNPTGIATDLAGNVYAAVVTQSVIAGRMYVTGSTINRITPIGIMSVLAGSDSLVGNADGVGTVAQFNYPQGIATDSDGNIYVADNRNAAIRKVTAGGLVSTLAKPNDNNFLMGIATDRTGNIYATDFYANTIRKINQAGVLSTVVGIAGTAGFTPGNLPGLLTTPKGVAISGTALYITSGNGVAVVQNLP